MYSYSCSILADRNPSCWTVGFIDSTILFFLWFLAIEANLIYTKNCTLDFSLNPLKQKEY